MSSINYVGPAAFTNGQKNTFNGLLDDSPIFGSYASHEKPLNPRAHSFAPVNDALLKTEQQEQKFEPKPYTVALKRYPVTMERKPYVPHPDERLLDPGTARANVAASREKPEGTPEWAEKHKESSVLAQHVLYFDRNHDGVIWPAETYHGLRDCGWSMLLSFIATVIIHVGLSYFTCPTIIPDPFFRIWIARIHKANHGSDTQTYDNEGRFRPQQFEDIFIKYDRDSKGGLSKREILNLIKGQRLAGDFFGSAAVIAEWLATYLLIWPADGILRKEDIRAVYDGSIFYVKAEEQRRKTLEAKRRTDRKRT